MPQRRLIVLLGLLALAGAALLALAGLYVASAFDPAARPGAAEVVLVAAVLAGVGALAFAGVLLRQHFRRLERLRGAMLTLAGNPGAVPPRHDAEEDARELRRLWAALGELAGRQAQARALPDTRLEAVLAAIAEGIVVITESGRVSLVNFPAKQLLGAEQVRVGTSVFAALEREPVLAAMRESARQWGLVEATLRRLDATELHARVAALPEHGGAVLSFAAGEVAEHRAEVEHALELHDTPPPPEPVTADTPLDRLPALVLDSETTGLDAAEARIVALGAVRLHGGRVYPGVNLDRLVRPEVPIPAAATAVHGITDAMVADAPRFPEAFADVRAMAEGLVIVGHNIGFDLAVLGNECGRHGLAWEVPPCLDTLLLAGALLPEREDLRLESLAVAFGVEVEGRHTALGDCLVAARVFQRMLPLLHDRGVTTLGAARRLAAGRKDLVKEQRASGW